MKHLILASASGLALATSPAVAQNARPSGPQPTAPTAVTDGTPAADSTPGANAPKGAAATSVTPTENGGLGDIIVTAQRVSQSAQKAPIAIAVVKPEELIRQNVTRAEDLSRVVPALVALASGGPNTSFYLRGVGNSTANSYSDAAISFNYDGVYIGRPNSTQGYFYDLQRVEVLKGPQGTVYGRNATGGAINVIPNRPVVGENSASMTASYGNYNAVQGQGAINLAVGSSAAFRVSGSVNRHDGYYSDGTGDQKEYGGRAQFLVNITPDLTTRFDADYEHQGGVGAGTFIYGTFAFNPLTGKYDFTPTPQLGAGIGVADPRSEAFVQTRFISQAGRNSEALGSYPSQNNHVLGITNETNWKTAAGTLTVQAAYRKAKVDSLSNASNFRGYRQREDDNQKTLEARFAGRLGNTADYLIGAFLFDENIDAHAAINQLTVLPFQDYKTSTNSKAVFGRFALHATDKLTLTAAGRYTDDTKRMNGLSNVFVLFCGNPAPPQDFCPNLPLFPLVDNAQSVISFYQSRGIPVTPVPLFVLPPQAGGSQTAPFVLNSQIPNISQLKTKKFTYRLAADYQITPRNLVYASYETGYHAGGFNFGRGLETYKPETIAAWTLGSKNRFFDNRLQLNVEAFYWRYKDQQVAQFGSDFSTPPISVFYTSNIGASRIKGIDADMEFLVTPTTRLAGSVQYLDSKYTSYTTNQGVNGPPPNVNCPFTVTTFRGAPSYAIDCSGKPALFSPKWSFNINGEQTFHLNDYKLVAQVGTRWRGDFYAYTSYQPWVISKAAFQSDASLTFAPNSDAWFITAFVNNIEDKRRITQSNANNSLNTQSALATAPRTYGLRVGAKFK